MDAPTIPDVADSSEGNFGDDIDIGLDVVYPVPVTIDAFPAVTIVAILASHGEAIQGIHEYLQGVLIEEEMSTLSKLVEFVKCHWNSNVEGHNMFKVVSNMKALKKPLRKLLHDHGNLHERVNKLRIELDVVQKELDLNPTDSYLREEENVYLKAFNEAKLNEERFLKQKAKIDWLEAGDFIFTSSNMVCDITNDEIKAAMFDIGDDKASGPDGYTFAFFKKGWSVVGHDVCNAVRDFFLNRCRSKGRVMEILSLILKRRVRMSDLFRFHKHCKELEIINVCFMDDLFIFAREDLASAGQLESLDEIKMERLPVKYLGVPFISSRLLNKDCKILVEKVKNRIWDWKNKSLSFAGRL
ncbi:hypothetical protein Tco_1427568 [Tanacetum coccineum]